MVPEPPEDEREAKARAAGLAFVPLDGDIGVIGNGAGLVMSTIDQIAAAGGKAADFCDIGGGARSEVAQAALEAMFAGPPVRRRARQHLRRHHALRGRRHGPRRGDQGGARATRPSSCASTATPPRRATPCSRPRPCPT